MLMDAEPPTEGPAAVPARQKETHHSRPLPEGSDEPKASTELIPDASAAAGSSLTDDHGSCACASVEVTPIKHALKRARSFLYGETTQADAKEVIGAD